MKKLDARKNAEFNKILIEANIALENQRTRLIQLKNMNKARFKTACDKGFEQIFISSLENNVTGISQGLNCILSSFNQNCKFNTLEELMIFLIILRWFLNFKIFLNKRGFYYGIGNTWSYCCWRNN